MAESFLVVAGRGMTARFFRDLRILFSLIMSCLFSRISSAFILVSASVALSTLSSES